MHFLPPNFNDTPLTYYWNPWSRCTQAKPDLMCWYWWMASRNMNVWKVLEMDKYMFVAAWWRFVVFLCAGLERNKSLFAGMSPALVKKWKFCCCCRFSSWLYIFSIWFHLCHSSMNKLFTYSWNISTFRGYSNLRSPLSLINQIQMHVNLQIKWGRHARNFSLTYQRPFYLYTLWKDFNVEMITYSNHVNRISSKA